MDLSLKQLAPFAALLLIFSGCATTTADRSSGSDLASFIDDATGQPPFDRAIWGVVVQDENGQIVYERNADTLLMPASNRKLFIAAAAAECFGPDSVIQTDLAFRGNVIGDTLHGDVILTGHGDPSLGGRHESDRDRQFAPFVAALAQRGIRRVTGRVIADVSDYDATTVHSSWWWSDLPEYYATPVDALAYNEDVIGVYVTGETCSALSATADPAVVGVRLDVACSDATTLRYQSDPAGNDVTVSGTASAGPVRETLLVAASNPGLYAAQALNEALERHGIEIDGMPSVERQRVPGAAKIASISSPPMVELLAVLLKVSHNLYADTMLKNLSLGDAPASWDRGLEIERRQLYEMAGIGDDETRFVDGSGLSSLNLVSPRAVAKIVNYMARPERRGMYDLILATPGEEGTLRRRLAGLETRFRGKTGYISGVAALSGWVVRPDGSYRTVVVMVNHYATPASEARKIIDAIVARAAE